MKIDNKIVDELIDKFFKVPFKGGYREIAQKLLTTGVCHVAGEERIWCGGVGNYIDVKPLEGSVGCSTYTLSREEFFNSGWVREFINDLSDNIDLEITSLQERKKMLTDLLEQ